MNQKAVAKIEVFADQDASDPIKGTEKSHHPEINYQIGSSIEP